MSVPILRNIYRVIVAEDDPGTAEFITAALGRYNFSVQVASDGRAALKRLEEEPYDLLLCDIMMPYLDGLKLLETSKARKMPLPRVLMLTALSDYETVVKAKGLGAHGYLVKPATAPQLIAKVKAILELSDESLIDKTAKPFSIHTGIAGEDIIINLVGCPVKNPQTDLIKAMSAATTVRSRYLNAQIQVGQDFIYDAEAFSRLTAMAQYLEKNHALFPNHITFMGAFFKEADSGELAAFKQRYQVVLE